MTNEVILGRLESIFDEIARLGGKRETTSIVTNLTVVDASPSGLTNYIIIQDNRDGDYIPALKVPGVVYANNDLVNVMFIEGTEPIAFQQGAGSGGGSNLTEAPTILIKNTSGVSASANDVGYIDVNGEYKTTTTANLQAIWCVVIQGGANNSNIYVAIEGRVTVNYTGTAPDGISRKFLTTSTSAGNAQGLTSMRPEVFAIVPPGETGSGGQVSALTY